MRLVFMGTPHYAAVILEELALHHEVAGVFTRADAVRGRGGGLVPSPVKELAMRLGLPVFTPRSLRDADVREQLAALAPDAIVVAAYGMILPKDVLDIPPLGCLNAHASLLPRWRGAAPVERAILSGDEETGVCIMRMEEGLDTGPVCVRRSLCIADRGTEELTDELANLAAAGMITALSLVEAGRPGWMAQDAEAATYAEKIRKEELLARPDDDPQTLARKVQASAAAHPCRCVVGGRAVSLLSVRIPAADDEAAAAGAREAAPGAVRFVAKRLFLGCAGGAVELLEVKPDGKQPMEGRAFAAGLQGLKAGTVTWEPWTAG